MRRSSRPALSGGRVSRRASRLLPLGLVIGCALLIAAGAVGTSRGAWQDISPSPSGNRPGLWSSLRSSASAASASSASSSPSPAAVVPYGDGSFTYADGMSTVVGSGGRLVRYRVAVEGAIGIDPSDFAADVDGVLADPRGWTADGTVRLQRVAPGTPVDFTVLLASPVTSEQLCRAEGNLTERYTNCRLRGQVVINSARWLTAVPDYRAPLSVYRAYAVNHEVGHELGEWHELCPGPGLPAPVMQQQTLGLQGCVANPWPYLDGVRYHGPPASV